MRVLKLQAARSIVSIGGDLAILELTELWGVSCVLCLSAKLTPSQKAWPPQQKQQQQQQR